MTWAVAQECGSPSAKLVLLMLANRTNSETGKCNPSHKNLAAECEIRPETLKTHLRSLADKGLINIEHRFHEGIQLSNQYHLNVGGGGVKQGEGGGVKRTTNQEDESGRLTTMACAKKFEDFWIAWPAGERKQDKRKCEEKWRKQKLDVQANEIIADVTSKRGTKKWADGFIEAPLVYLNGQRWLDAGTVNEAQWWDGKTGICAQGDKYAVPYNNTMASGNGWLRYVAAVWLASGDGPWWQSNPNVRPVALGLKSLASKPTEMTMKY